MNEKDSCALQFLEVIPQHSSSSSLMTPTTPEGATRRRTTRACDQCRKTKSRCEHPPQLEEPCRNCALSGTECTFLEPSHKRGPPKGYLSALEQRLHDAEALLGVIISSPDPRATTMVQDLSKDSLAAAIITRVTNSTFGPIGRNALQQRESNNTNPRRRSVDLRNQQIVEQETPAIDGNGHLVFTTPSHTWQDYLNLRLSLESRIRSQDVLKPFPQDSVTTPHIPQLSGAKLPPLDTPFHFQVCSTIDASNLNMDACVVMSSPPTSNDKIVNGQLEENAIPQPQGAETILVDITPSDADIEYTKNVYNRDYLARSLGLETGFSPIVDASLTTTQPVSESPLELNKTRIRWTKAEEVDTASWTRLVVEGTESTLYENVSAVESDVQMHAELTQTTCVSTQG